MEGHGFPPAPAAGGPSHLLFSRRAHPASPNQSRYYYYHTNQGVWAGLGLKALTLLGATLRLFIRSMLAVIRPGAREQARLFADVWRRTLLMSPNGDP